MEKICWIDVSKGSHVFWKFSQLVMDIENEGIVVECWVHIDKQIYILKIKKVYELDYDECYMFRDCRFVDKDKKEIMCDGG